MLKTRKESIQENEQCAIAECTARIFSGQQRERALSLSLLNNTHAFFLLVP